MAALLSRTQTLIELLHTETLTVVLSNVSHQGLMVSSSLNKYKLLELN